MGCIYILYMTMTGSRNKWPLGKHDSLGLYKMSASYKHITFQQPLCLYRYVLRVLLAGSLELLFILFICLFLTFITCLTSTIGDHKAGYNHSKYNFIKQCILKYHKTHNKLN